MTTKRTGRRPKLTPEVQAKICDAIRAGNYPEAAAEHAGINRATYYRWLAKGENATSGLYRDFRDAVKKAESHSEVGLVALWRKAAAKNWVAAAALLERRFRGRWSRTDHLKVDATVGTKPDDQLLAKLAKLVERAADGDGTKGGAESPGDTTKDEAVPDDAGDESVAPPADDGTEFK